MKCEDISEDVVDLFALDKHSGLDDDLISHLKTCPACRERVREAREWAAEIRKIERKDASPR
jgi:hypothetical protein